MIRDTKSRYYDERPKVLICQLNFSFFFCLIFLHMIRIALVYLVHVTCGICFFRLFFSRVFAKMSTGFS